MEGISSPQFSLHLVQWRHNVIMVCKACSGLCLTENYCTQPQPCKASSPSGIRTQKVRVVRRNWSPSKRCPTDSKARHFFVNKGIRGCKSGGQIALGSVVSLNHRLFIWFLLTKIVKYQQFCF